MVESGDEFFADVYKLFAEKGISAIAVDEMDLWQVGASLGWHRSVDWWNAAHDVDREIAEESAPRRKGKGGVRSPHTTRTPPQRVAASRSQFEARRAHARGEGPKPEAQASPAAARIMSMLNQG